MEIKGIIIVKNFENWQYSIMKFKKIEMKEIE